MKMTSFAFLVNGVPTGNIIPSRVFCQGDLMSLYLFLFALELEGLSGLLRRATERGAIHGYRLCQGAPKISHFKFLDDTIIFCGAKEK